MGLPQRLYGPLEQFPFCPFLPLQSSFPMRGRKGLIRGGKTYRRAGLRGGFGGRPILYAASPASVMR
jgi:hypothetical protein